MSDPTQQAATRAAVTAIIDAVFQIDRMVDAAVHDIRGKCASLQAAAFATDHEMSALILLALQRALIAANAARNEDR